MAFLTTRLDLAAGPRGMMIYLFFALSLVPAFTEGFDFSFELRHNSLILMVLNKCNMTLVCEHEIWLFHLLPILSFWNRINFFKRKKAWPILFRLTMFDLYSLSSLLSKRHPRWQKLWKCSWGGHHLLWRTGFHHNSFGIGVQISRNKLHVGGEPDTHKRFKVSIWNLLNQPQKLVNFVEQHYCDWDATIHSPGEAGGRGEKPWRMRGTLLPGGELYRFLATLVALHSTPFSHSVGGWAKFRYLMSCRLVKNEKLASLHLLWTNEISK